MEDVDVADLNKIYKMHQGCWRRHMASAARRSPACVSMQVAEDEEEEDENFTYSRKSRGRWGCTGSAGILEQTVKLHTVTDTCGVMGL